MKTPEARQFYVETLANEYAESATFDCQKLSPLERDIIEQGFKAGFHAAIEVMGKPKCEHADDCAAMYQQAKAEHSALSAANAKIEVMRQELKAELEAVRVENTDPIVSGGKGEKV